MTTEDLTDGRKTLLIVDGVRIRRWTGKESNARSRKRNPDSLKERCRVYRAKHRERLRREAADLRRRSPERRRYERDKFLQRKYGVTLEWFETVIIRQDGKCALCGSNFVVENRKPAVDHSHKTGAVRAIICGDPCNLVLGNFEKHSLDPTKFTAYLEKYNGL